MEPPIIVAQFPRKRNCQPGFLINRSISNVNVVVYYAQPALRHHQRERDDNADEVAENEIIPHPS